MQDFGAAGVVGWRPISMQPIAAKETAMPRHPHYIPHGVIPAVLLPFNDDLSIDEKSFRGHLRDVAAVKGLSAVTINAHSTEVASCTLEEQAQVMDAAVDAIGDKTDIVHGIYAEGSLEAARIAKQAAKGGAAALLVFPPGPFTMGQNAEMVLAHFKRIADASDCRSSPSSIRWPPRAIRTIRSPACSTRCRPSALSRTGATAFPSMSATSSNCRAASARSTCSPRTRPGCSARSCWVAMVCCRAPAA